MIIPLITRGSKKYRFAAKGYKTKEASQQAPIITSFSVFQFTDNIDPGEITFSYNVSDADGTVDKLELLRQTDGGGFSVVVTETAGAPFTTGQIVDSAIPVGTNQHKLRITDNDSNITETSFVIENEIFAPSVIVTFDKVGDKVLANAELVPGETLVTAYKGNGGNTQQLNGVGIADSSVGSSSPHAWYMSSKDLSTGTWLMKWKWSNPREDLAGGGAQNIPVAIVDQVRTAPYDWTASNGISVVMAMRRTGDTDAGYFFGYNSGGSLNAFRTVSAVAGWNWGSGTVVLCEIEKTATHVIWRFDTGNALGGGTDVQQIVLGSITLGAGEFGLAGSPLNIADWRLGFDIDDWEGVS